MKPKWLPWDFRFLKQFLAQDEPKMDPRMGRKFFMTKPALFARGCGLGWADFSSLGGSLALGSTA